MDISVIIPSYAPQEYLWECLDSLFNQTLDKARFEVILVLNGCNEPYRESILEWKSQHSPLNIKFFQTDEKGVSNARNIGLDNASGDFICFIDDDDYVSPEYLESLFNNASDSCVAISDVIGFDDNTGIPIKDFKPHKKHKELYGKAINLNNGRIFFRVGYIKLIPRQVIGARRFNKNFYLGEDSVFMFLISDRISSIKLAPSNAIYYRRIRPDSVFFKKRSFKQEFTERLKIIREYNHIYFSSPKTYKLSFYITRILASIKAIIYNIAK